jgi:hypothetical protein
MALSDAIKELREEIVKFGYSPGLVDEIATDHGIKTPLLARKFEEQYGASPENYRIPEFDISPIQTARDEFRSLLQVRGHTATIQQVCDRLNALAPTAGFAAGYAPRSRRRRRYR